MSRFLIPDPRLEHRDSPDPTGKWLILLLFWGVLKFHPAGGGEQMAAPLDFEIGPG
jgi:hypothetical protein